jgi:hypothetical protein
LRVRSDEQLDEDAAATIADPAHDAETTMSNRDRSVKYLVIAAIATALCVVSQLV